MVEESVIIIGAGGHGRVLLDALWAAKAKVVGFSDNDEGLQRTKVRGLDVISDEAMLERFPPGRVVLANGIGMVSATRSRQGIFNRFCELGYEFVRVLHPTALIAPDVQLGRGVQVMAGGVVQTGSSIGDDTIVNTKASVDHDCRIAAHVHIAPGVTLSGNVVIGEGAFIGVGATVSHGITIGSGATVGAGAVVLRNVAGGTKVLGVPAKERS